MARDETEAAAFTALIEDMRQHGQRVPIWRSGPDLIDGHKRQRACEILGIEPQVVDTASGDGYALEVLRPHYTTNQRAILIAKTVTAGPSEGMRRYHALAARGKTVSDAAAEVAVTRPMIAVARRVRLHGSHAVITAVEQGTLTLYAARQIADAALPPEAQTAAAARVVALGRVGNRQQAAKALGKLTLRSSPQRALAWRMDRALNALDSALDILDGFLQEPGVRTDEARLAWIKRLTAAKEVLTQNIALTQNLTLTSLTNLPTKGRTAK